MLQMMKSNYLHYRRAEMLLIFILISFSYWSIDMPIFMMSFVIFPAVISDIFYYEKKNESNRFFVSLPVHSRSIIQSRYIFFLVYLLVMTLYQWMTAYGIDILTDKTDYVYQWKTALIAFSLGLIVASFILPLFYLFRSIYSAVIIMLILIFSILVVSLDPLVQSLDMTEYISFNHVDSGYIILTETYLSPFPFLIVLIIACICYYLSSELSVWLFNRKDK